MKLAWFRPQPRGAAARLDHTAPLLAALRFRHDIDVVAADAAHDFVWKHFRAPYDLCVFELDDTPAHAFVWPYLLQYGGVLFLHAPTLHRSRAGALLGGHRRDEYIAEFTFSEGRPPRRLDRNAGSGPWPMLRVPLLAARVTVISHRSAVEPLQRDHREARVRYAPPAVAAVAAPARDAEPAAVRFGILATDRLELARRALARARRGGAGAALIADASPERLLHDADIILSLDWSSPPTGHAFALSAIAAGRPLVVPETEAAADWPAFDPQSWRPRAMASEPPIAVSIDLRDEEHSLVLAFRRLSSDAALRAQLGNAARAWWRTHATVERAEAAWERILSEAAAVHAAPPPAGWPKHLRADGSERARSILAEFGLSVDFLA